MSPRTKDRPGALIGLLCMVMCIAASFPAKILAEPNPQDIVKKCFDHYRGQASAARIEMIIHRPSWERKMVMDAWTQGEENSLVRIISPPKDEGNATLKKGHDMYTYNPKVNRVIKLPPAMMAQAWMGSDFSNNDLAKTDRLIYDYEHSLSSVENMDDMKVYIIKSMPKPMAAVVWGMQVIKIREDFVMLSQEFFDEELVSVKKMVATDIQMMGGRPFPKICHMAEAGQEDQFTELRYQTLEFPENLPERMFTVNELKRPYRR